MIDVHGAVERILDLAQPRPERDQVATAFGVILTRCGRNPLWEEYTGGPAMGFSSIEFSLGPLGCWSFRARCRPDPGPCRKDLELARYGAVVGMNITPEIPPAGRVGYVHGYRGFPVSFQFEVKTDRLTLVAIHYVSPEMPRWVPPSSSAGGGGP
jgi:hypothetical protein